MRTPAAVRVDDDLTTGQSGVTLSTASMSVNYYETTVIRGPLEKNCNNWQLLVTLYWTDNKKLQTAQHYINRNGSVLLIDGC